MEILVDFDILQIKEVNDNDFSISFVMYFGITWEEPRIFKNSSTPELYHSIDLEFFNSLWVPDVYFYHLKSISSGKILTDFAGTVGPLLLRRPGHFKCDAIIEVDAIFEG